MPLTSLDSKTALILIDLQKGIVGGNFIHPIADVINRARALIDCFRSKNLPVVLVNVAGRAPARPLPKDGPTFCLSWIRNRVILPSPSGVGAHSQQRILKPSSKPEALPKLLWLV